MKKGKSKSTAAAPCANIFMVTTVYSYSYYRCCYYYKTIINSYGFSFSVIYPIFLTINFFWITVVAIDKLLTTP